MTVTCHAPVQSLVLWDFIALPDPVDFGRV